MSKGVIAIETTTTTTESRRWNVSSVGWDVAPVDGLDSIRFDDVIMERMEKVCKFRHVLFDIRRDDVKLDDGCVVVDFDDGFL